MAKKVKCMDCTNSMRWALPERVRENNLEYAKHCACVAKKSIVCGETMKTKGINHEQYCKKYREKEEWDRNSDTAYSEEIAELERKIEDYEHTSNHKQTPKSTDTAWIYL